MSAVHSLRHRSRAIRRGLRLAVLCVIASAIAIILVFPLLWMFTGALKTKELLLEETVVNLIPPRPWQWHNFIDAWTAMDFTRFLINTLIITATSIVGGLLTASMVAYGFARLRFRGRNLLFMIVLGTMMVPAQVTAIPTFLLYHHIGWLNTYLPLIVPFWMGGGAFYIFLLRQYITTIPTDLDDAARVDGCSPVGIYRHVILPNIKPALATAAIFLFLSQWNDLWGPMLYLTDDKLWTLARGMLSFKRTLIMKTHGGGLQTYQIHWFLALGTMTMLPVLAFYLAFQRHFVSGVVTSGLKG